MKLKLYDKVVIKGADATHVWMIKKISKGITSPIYHFINLNTGETDTVDGDMLERIAEHIVPISDSVAKALYGR